MFTCPSISCEKSEPTILPSLIPYSAQNGSPTTFSSGSATTSTRDATSVLMLGSSPASTTMMPLSSANFLAPLWYPFERDHHTL